VARRQQKNRRNASRSNQDFGKRHQGKDRRHGETEDKNPQRGQGRHDQQRRNQGRSGRDRSVAGGADRNRRSWGGAPSFQVQSPEAIRDSLQKILAERVTAKDWIALAERFRERLKNADWEPAQGASSAQNSNAITTRKPTSDQPLAAVQAATAEKKFAPIQTQFAPSRSYKKTTQKDESSAPLPSSPQRSAEPGMIPVVQAQPEVSSARPPDRGFALARARNTSVAKPSETHSHAQVSSAATVKTIETVQSQTRVSESGLHLDPWQAEAFDALIAGQNVVVDAPTSAGKTRVIEALLDARLSEGLRLIYTSPVKSLSNDKYREFCEKYGKERVGINTGDFKENLRAPIILATLETYRNSLLGVEPDMRRRVVVYDEYHYLQDESRGSAWEESLILTPKESQVILLSASVPNADEFAHWLEQLFGRPSKLIRVSRRPVPLADLIYTTYGWIYAPDLALRPEEIANIRRTVRADKANRRRRDKARFDELIDPVRVALEQNMGPVVVYAGRRADVEAIAHVLSRGLQGTITDESLKSLHDRLNTLSGWDYVPHELQRMIRRFGIAFHHSGLIPPGRVAIETVLKEGFLKVCSGTMGISLGVNFAVRSALISDLSRPSEGGETKYSASEVMQMLGRAGRRGKDTYGFSLWMNLGRFAEQKPTGREPCRSSLKFDPTTVLGLLGQKESIAYLSEFYRKSFFMRGRDPQQVIVADHELISALLYKDFKIDLLACSDIPATYQKFFKGHQRSSIPCSRCPAKLPCHTLMSQSRQSTLQKIITHLSTIGALENQVPTLMGQLARHFPQAGGLIIARKLAQGEINVDNLRHYLQMMASFCSAHFKEIPETYADMEFLNDLNMVKEIEFHYPEELFPELYDELGFRREESGQKVFREFNMAAASIVSAWIDEQMSWEQLVEEHTTKHFSAGDCMMVLFRFATFLQSLARLSDFDAELAQQARALIPLVLRDPLDARNRMLTEETNEFESEDSLAPAAVEENSDGALIETEEI